MVVVVSIALSCIFIFLIILKIRKNRVKNREQKLFQKMGEALDLNRLNATSLDHFGLKMLALDILQRKLIYLDHHHSRNQVVIDLNEVKECNLILKKLNVQLELVYKNPYKTPLTIPFYRKFIDRKGLKRTFTRKSVYWKNRISEVLRQSEELVY